MRYSSGLTTTQEKQYRNYIRDYCKSSLRDAAESTALERYQRLVNQILDQRDFYGGDRNAVLSFIVNFPLDYDKNTALHLVAYNYCTQHQGKTVGFIQYLYDNFANSELQNDTGRRPDQMGNAHSHPNPLGSVVPKQKPKPIVTLEAVIDSQDKVSLEQYMDANEGWYREKVSDLPVLNYAAKKCGVDFFQYLVGVFSKASGASTERAACEATDSNHFTPLHYAAWVGNAETTALLLEIGVNFHAVGGAKNKTPLHLAAEKKRSDATVLLINAGVNLGLKDQEGQRADQYGRCYTNPVAIERDKFFAAIEKGHVETIKEYLERNATFLFLTNSKDENPLFFAANKGTLGAVISAYESLDSRPQVLVARVLQPLIKDREKVGGDTLATAWVANSANTKFEELEWIEKQGLPLTGGHTKKKSTLLHAAAFYNNVVAANFLIKLAKAAIDAPNADGITPLGYAAEGGYQDIVDILLEAGANDDNLQAAESILRSQSLGASQKINGLIQLFRAHKKALTADQIGRLIQLAINCDVDLSVIGFLLNLENFDPDWVDSEGHSLLLFVVKKHSENIRLAELLVSRRVAVDFRDSQDNTLVHYAATRSLAMVDWLGQKGLSLDQPNKSGVVPGKITRGSHRNVIAKHLDRLVLYALGKAKKPATFGRAWLPLILPTESASDYNTFIHAAAAFGNLKALRAVRTLFGSDADGWMAEVNRTKPSVKNRSPLAYALAKSQREVAEFLIAEGADVAHQCEVSSNCSTAPCSFLAYTVATIQPKLFFLLLGRKGLDVNEKFTWAAPKAEPLVDITPIQAAVLLAGKDSEILEALIKAGADVSQAYDQQALPYCKPLTGHPNPLWDLYKEFMSIVKSGEPRAIIDFLNSWTNTTWLKLVDYKTRLTPIHYLAGKGGLDALVALHKSFNAVVLPLLSAPDNTPDRRMPLHHAVLSNDYRMVEWLVKTIGVDVNAPDADGNTAYHLAVGKVKDEKMMDLLLKLEAKPGLTNNAGLTAEQMSSGGWFAKENPAAERKKRFLNAIREDDLRTVQAMYAEHSASLVPDSFDDFLAIAASHGSAQVFQFLGEQSIQKDGNNNAVKRNINDMGSSYDTDTLILRVIRNQYWRLMDWYITNGADVSLFNSHKTSPLWLAASSNHTAIVDKLLKAGAEVDGRQSETETPLMVSVRNQYNESTELLLCAGADTALTGYYEGGYYRADEFDYSTGYLHQKAQVAFDLVQALTIDIEGLPAKFPEALGEHAVALGKLREQLQLSKRAGTLTQLSDVFTSKAYKKLMNVPMLELQAVCRQAQEIHQQYETAKADLYREALDGPFDQYMAFFTPKNRVVALRNNLSVFHASIDQRRGRALCSQYDESVLLLIRSITGSENSTRIEKGKYDYAALTPQKYKELLRSIYGFEQQFSQLEKEFDTAVRAIFTEQKEGYKALEEYIDQLNYFKTVLPKGSEFWSKSEGWFGSALSVRVNDCDIAIAALAHLADKEGEMPGFEVLSANKDHLTNLQKELPKLVKFFGVVLSEYNQAEVKREREASKREREAATQSVKFDIESINKASQGLNKFLKQYTKSNFPAYVYFLNQSRDLPESSYSEELVAANEAVRKSFSDVAARLGVRVGFFLEIPTKSAGQVKVEDVAEFRQAAAQCLEDLGSVQRALATAFEADAKENERLREETQLRQELRQTIKSINSSCGAIAKALGSKEPDEGIISTLDEFRGAVGCVSKGLSAVTPNSEQISKADQKTLNDHLRLAQSMQGTLNRYHEVVDRKNYAAEKTRQREAELRSQISRQAATTNKKLQKIQSVLAEKPADASALHDLNAFRKQVGCVRADGVEDIVVLGETLDELKEPELKALNETAKRADYCAQQYHTRVLREDKTAKADERAQRQAEERQARLRSEIGRQAKTIDATLQKIRKVLAEKPADASALRDLNAFRDQVGCVRVDGVEDIVVSEATLGRLGELELTDVSRAGKRADSCAQKYLRQVVQEDKEAKAEERRQQQAEERQEQKESRMRDRLGQRLLALNGILRETQKYLESDPVDTEALREVSAFRALMSDVGEDLKSIAKPAEIGNWKEDELTPKLEKIETAISAAERYRGQVLSVNKAAHELAARERQLRQDIRTNVAEINRELKTARTLRGTTEFESAMSKASVEIRRALSGSNTDLDDIDIEEGVLDDQNEDALQELLAQVQKLMLVVQTDQRTLRDRNFRSFGTMVSHEINQFNVSLNSLKAAADGDTSALYQVAGRIEKIAKQVARKHKYQTYTDIDYDDKKVQEIPVDQHEAIAQKFVELKAALDVEKEALNKQRSKEEAARREKISALEQLEKAVGQLNEALDGINRAIAEKGGVVPNAFIDEMDNTWRKQLEDEPGWFSSKTLSTSQYLEPIKFSQKYCQKYETTDLQSRTEGVRALTTKVRSAHERLAEVQDLQSQLKEQKKLLEAAMAQLDERETGAAQTFIKVALNPDSENPQSADDIEKLQETLQSAKTNVEILHGKVGEQKARRSAVAENVQGAVVKLNRQLAGLRKQVGRGVEDDFGATEALGRVRGLLGDLATDPLADITIDSTLFNSDVDESALLAVVQEAADRVPTIQKAIDDKKKELFDAMNEQYREMGRAFKEEPTVKEKFEKRRAQVGDSAKQYKKKTVADLQGIQFDFDALVENVQEAVQEAKEQREQTEAKQAEKRKLAEEKQREEQRRQKVEQRRKVRKQREKEVKRQPEEDSDTETEASQRRRTISQKGSDREQSETKGTERKQRAKEVERQSQEDSDDETRDSRRSTSRKVAPPPTIRPSTNSTPTMQDELTSRLAALAKNKEKEERREQQSSLLSDSRSRVSSFVEEEEPLPTDIPALQKTCGTKHSAVKRLMRAAHQAGKIKKDDPRVAEFLKHEGNIKSNKEDLAVLQAATRAFEAIERSLQEPTSSSRRTDVRTVSTPVTPPTNGGLQQPRRLDANDERHAVLTSLLTSRDSRPEKGGRRSVVPSFGGSVQEQDDDTSSRFKKPSPPPSSPPVLLPSDSEDDDYTSDSSSGSHSRNTSSRSTPDKQSSPTLRRRKEKTVVPEVDRQRKEEERQRRREDRKKLRAKQKAADKAKNQELIGLLRDVYKTGLQTPLYFSLYFHGAEVFKQNGGLTSQEEHHWEHFYQTITKMNVKIKAHIATLESLETLELNHEALLLEVENNVQEMLRILDQLAKHGRTTYPGQNEEEKKASWGKNITAGSLGLAGWYLRRKIDTTGRSVPNSDVGVFNNFQELCAAWHTELSQRNTATLQPAINKMKVERKPRTEAEARRERERVARELSGNTRVRRRKEKKEKRTKTTVVISSPAPDRSSSFTVFNHLPSSLPSVEELDRQSVLSDVARLNKVLQDIKEVSATLSTTTPPSVDAERLEALAALRKSLGCSSAEVLGDLVPSSDFACPRNFSISVSAVTRGLQSHLDVLKRSKRHEGYRVEVASQLGELNVVLKEARELRSEIAKLVNGPQSIDQTSIKQLNALRVAVGCSKGGVDDVVPTREGSGESGLIRRATVEAKTHVEALKGSKLRWKNLKERCDRRRYTLTDSTPIHDFEREAARRQHNSDVKFGVIPEGTPFEYTNGY